MVILFNFLRNSYPMLHSGYIKKNFLSICLSGPSWTEEPGRLQSTGSLRIGHDWATSLSCIGEGSGNPLQCSCLENPRDGGAWWAAVYGVAQSWTWLTRLSSSSSSISCSMQGPCCRLSSYGTQGSLPHGMCHLSSPTRDQMTVPYIGRWILNHWTTREVQISFFPFPFLF